MIEAYYALVSTVQKLPKEKVERLYRRVQLPPGYTLAAVARFVLPRAVFKRYVVPAIADMQDEYIDALANGNVWHARCIAVRGHLLVIPGWVYAFVAGKLSELRRGR